MADEQPVAETPEVSPEVPESTLKPLDEVAREVIASRWGRGNKRKLRLKNAGYDPEAVQREVDKIFNRS